MFTIMIIEDNELIRNEIHNLLDLNKYKTIKIHDFNNITNQVKEYNPDLILLDINLPNDDGFKIWDWNLDTEDWKGTPQTIVNNVNKYSNQHSEVVLLMHEKEQSVKALQGIINK